MHPSSAIGAVHFYPQIIFPINFVSKQLRFFNFLLLEIHNKNKNIKFSTNIFFIKKLVHFECYL
jgi:hypothetical protein